MSETKAFLIMRGEYPPEQQPLALILAASENEAEQRLGCEKKADGAFIPTDEIRRRFNLDEDALIDIEEVEFF